MKRHEIVTVVFQGASRWEDGDGTEKLKELLDAGWEIISTQSASAVGCNDERTPGRAFLVYILESPERNDGV